MNPSQSTLYRVHQMQSEQLGEAALPYEEFDARLLKAQETEVTGLLSSASGVKVKIQLTVNTRFTLGHLCITQGVADALPADEVLKAIARHAAGDWGLLGGHDWRLNDQSLHCGGRLFSIYATSSCVKFWITTSADRCVTKVSLPQEQ